MFSGIRKRLTYTNVAMTVALVFAMSGGAYAAKHYLITSTKQISPKVLKALAGKRGPAGPQGAAGAQGPEGKAGAPGKEGSSGKEGIGKEGSAGKEGPQGKTGSPWTPDNTLPTGATLKGTWAVLVKISGGGGYTSSDVGFGIPLATAPAVHYINAAGKELTATVEATSTECLGSVAEPTAKPGNLCVYAGRENNLSTETSINPLIVGWQWGIAVYPGTTQGTPAEGGSTANTATPFGFGVFALATAEGNLEAKGTYAVTAG